MSDKRRAYPLAGWEVPVSLFPLLTPPACILPLPPRHHQQHITTTQPQSLPCTISTALYTVPPAQPTRGLFSHPHPSVSPPTSLTRPGPGPGPSRSRGRRVGRPGVSPAALAADVVAEGVGARPHLVLAPAVLVAAPAAQAARPPAAQLGEAAAARGAVGGGEAAT